MRSVKYLIAAGAASLISTSALAADMASIMPPPPPLYAPPPPCCEDFGGWYLRGDIGMSNQSVKSLSNILNTAPGTTVTPVFYDFDSAMTFGGGVGYQFNNWLRVDGTLEYRGKSNFHGFEIVNAGGPTTTDQYTGSKSEWLALANAYADLGTWWCITPFVGVGIGTSRNTISNFVDINQVTTGIAFGRNTSQWQFAYAAYAGLSYKVNNSFTVELAYRYLNMGDGLTGDLQTYNGINAVNNPTTFKTLTSQDVRLGVRWSLQPTPAPAYAPPLIRKG